MITSGISLPLTWLKCSRLGGNVQSPESKNCKQATPYVMPSPAITGISGNHSNFIWPLDLGSSHKKRKPALPPTHKAVASFLSTKLHILVRHSRVFMDFLSMDGDEVSTATMCPTKQHTSCWCPRDQLQDNDQVFPFRDTQLICSELETEQEQLLNQDGTPTERAREQVSYFCIYLLYI